MRKLTQGLTVHIGAEVPIEYRTVVHAEAQRLGVSASAVVRWALAAYFPQLQDDPTEPEEKSA